MKRNEKEDTLSVMIIALVCALIGGGVYAYFSDTETSTGNTFTAGTLDLVVDDENPWTFTAVTFDCIEPDVAVTPVSINVENEGCITGDLYMRFTNLTDTTETQTEPECDCELGTWNQGTQTCSGMTNETNDISTQITLSCTWDGSPLGSFSVLLSAAPSTWTLIDTSFGTGIKALTIGGTLASAASDCYQGDRSTFNIELALVQDGQTP